MTLRVRMTAVVGTAVLLVGLGAQQPAEAQSGSRAPTTRRGTAA